jgi:hypothetical protein
VFELLNTVRATDYTVSAITVIYHSWHIWYSEKLIYKNYLKGRAAAEIPLLSPASYEAHPQSKFPWGRVQKQNSIAWKYLLQQI